MRKLISVILALALILILAPHVNAAKKPVKKGAKKTAKTRKPAPPKTIKDMTDEELTQIARSAAPNFISKDAMIMTRDDLGGLRLIIKGTNQFTCLPDVSGQETPDPVCADKAGLQWFNDAANKLARPTNIVPGIAYMAKGGWHWEKNGVDTIERDGAKRTKEAPHWMILWPFASSDTGMPALHGRFGTHVMYDGTPWSHLMIYQDPKNMTAAHGH